MSGYTIDIQLTELGFPNVFRNEDTGTKTSPAVTSKDSSFTHKTHPNSQTSTFPSLYTHNRSPNGSPSFVSCSSQNEPAGAHLLLKSIPNNDSNSLSEAGTDTAQDFYTQQRSPVSSPKNIIKHMAIATAAIRNTIKQSGSGKVPQLQFKQVSKAKISGVLMKRKGGDKPGNDDRKPLGKRAIRDNNVNQMEEDSEDTDNSDVSEDDEDEDDEEEEMAPSDIPTDNLGEYRCKVCNLSLPSAFRLCEHMHLHSGARPYRCAECGKQFCHLANYRTHLRRHAKATAVRCRICDASFETVEGLQAHLKRTHLKKGVYQCEFCKDIFTSLEECHRHVEQHQRGLMRHQCPECNRQFRRYKSLCHHLEQQNCTPSYVCTECGQAFPKKTILLRHSFSHLGLLPYTCVRCQRHFRLASLYRKHECKPERIQCVACLGFFHSQRDFQRHKEETGCWGHQGARGDELRCMECGQAFEKVDELKKHAGAHQRVLTCSECGMGFRSSLLLMSHMGGHAGSRPCLCQHCGLGFPHQQAYESHQKDCTHVLPLLGPSAAKVGQSTKKPIRTDKSSASQEKMWQIKLNKIPHPFPSVVLIVPTQAKASAQLGTTLTKAIPTEAVIRGRLLPEKDFFNTKEVFFSSSLFGPSERGMQINPMVAAEGSRTEMRVLDGSSEDKNMLKSLNGKGLKLEVGDAQIEVKEGIEQLNDEEKADTGNLQQASPFLRCTAKITMTTNSTVGQPTKTVLLSETVNEMSKTVKQTPVCLRNAQSEMALALLKEKEKASSIITRGLSLQRWRVGQASDLIPVKCEMVSVEGINGKPEVDSQGSNDVNVEDHNGGGTGDFHFVEVEIGDEMGKGETGDEPHECVNCGQILLDGNLLEHYMQHAMQSDCPFPDYSAQTWSHPLSPPPPSPPRRKLRPRKCP